jgi:hypothetical protein
MHFSPDGRTLYYLLCSFTDAAVGSVCSLSVSSFNFPSNADELGEDLTRSNLNEHITYHIAKSVQEISPAFILTHWTTEYLYVALPILSSRPKIVRLALNPTGRPNAPSTKFQTLQHPLYFPGSTHYRNPRLCIQTSTKLSSKTKSNAPIEQLILALDPDPTPKSEEQSVKCISSPTLMIWSISGINSWRDWEKGIDGQSAELQTTQSKYDILRGSFVDSENCFSIPIRSGLDWTKKAFVSCA